MANAVPARDDRIDLRVPTALKELLNRAAAYAGMSLSGFLVSAASDRALEVVRERESITLTARDWQAFLVALDAPPRPRPKLEAAVRRYRRNIARRGKS